MSRVTTTEKVDQCEDEVITQPTAVSAKWGDRIGAFIAIVLGLLTIWEAMRLAPFAMNAASGDHVMPLVVGVLLVGLGIVALFAFQKEEYQQAVTFAQGEPRKTMLYTLGLLFGYWLLVSVIGYLLATFVISLSLFKVIGTYKWHISLLCALTVTSCLYLFFVVLLGMSFPTSWLGL